MVLLDSHGISRVPRYLGYRLGVCLNFGYGTFTLFGRPFQTLLLPSRFVTPCETPRNPAWPKPHGLGCSHFARHYLGNHCCFLFLGVLRCFSSPGVPPYAYGFSVEYHPITDGGLPHSEIPGSKPAYGSPRRFGVCPVLLRHLAPRHPPCALRSLT